MSEDLEERLTRSSARPLKRSSTSFGRRRRPLDREPPVHRDRRLRLRLARLRLLLPAVVQQRGALATSRGHSERRAGRRHLRHYSGGGALIILGNRRLRQGFRGDWLVAGWTAVIAGLLSSVFRYGS